MPAPRTFQGQRAAFLDFKAEIYVKAKANGTAKDVTVVIQQEFFKRWPVDLPLNVERPQSELDAVDDDEPLPERPHPDASKDTVSEEEYAKAMTAYKEYQSDVTTRKRIENRLKDNYNKAHATNMKGSDKQYLSDLLVELTHGKAKGKGGKHRKELATEACFELSMKRVKRRRSLRRLPKSEQEEWENKMQEDRKREMAEWKEKRDGKPSEAPEDQQAIHGGASTKGPVQMDQGRAEVEVFSEHTFLSMGRFLRKSYTVEECRSRAMAVIYGVEGKNKEEVEVMRWREGEGLMSKDDEDKGKDSGGSQEQPSSSSQKDGAKANAKETAATSSCQRSGRKSKKNVSNPSAARSDTEESLPDGEDDVEVSRSSPPRTQNSTRQESLKTATAMLTASAPNGTIEVPRASPPRTCNSADQDKLNAAPTTPPNSPPIRSVSPAASLVISLVPSLGGVVSPVPSIVPLFPGTSPSLQSYHTSPPARGRDATPPPDPHRSASPLPNTPTPHHSPSPLPSTPVRSSGKRTRVVSGKLARQPKKIQKEEKPTTAPVRKRKGQEEGGLEEEREGSSKKVRVSVDDGEALPELPAGVRNGKDDFYASQALVLFGHEEVRKLKGWVSLVKKWMELEERLQFEGSKLSAKGRPTWVTEWIQRGRSPTYLKPNHDVYKFLEDWWKWWKLLQPDWRGFNDAGRLYLPEEYPEGGSWDTLRVGGSNGLTSVLAGLVYAAVQLSRLSSSGTGREKGEAKKARLDCAAAVEDVNYVLQCLLASSS
ncbi:SERTA domain-containing protein 3 [Marasmius crinis-equi]|uniref:SERTA domain-containing protein 3 n=1 Tax=Marasmius crinis-equi TaxID=585013 RepID=A0ABR3ETJ4_9AGAR